MNKLETKISIIIPTVNAVDELDLTLTSLAKNSDLPHEIIVIVDPDLRTGQINESIISVCHKHNLVPHLNSSNLGPYGNWNKGASLSSTDYFVFATDDQYFAPHWDRQLLAAWRPKRLVAGQLVEPGIIPVYKTNLEQDFGATAKDFKEAAFIKWCSSRREHGFKDDGFFIPLLQSRQDFDALGHYQTSSQFGTSAAKSNDYEYIHIALARGYQFGTALDSYSYHFQASSWKKKRLSPKITAIVLTKNESSDLANCLKSLTWVNQVIVLDSGSTDETLTIAKKHGATILKRKFDDFASQRNYAIAHAQDADWVLMIDADEQVEGELAKELLSFAKDIYLDGVRLRRKNYLFGRFIEHSDWYPDYRLVFFRPKMASYLGEVHERLVFNSSQANLADSTNHLLHHNYDTLAEFVTKNLVDYPLQYAKVLDQDHVQFSPADLFSKPIGEFLRRYFLSEGYKDGLYGLVLSLLMGAQTLVAYAYLWEIQGKRQAMTSEETKALFAVLRLKGRELSYWLSTKAVENSRGAQKIFNRVKRKAIKLIGGL